MRFIFYFIFLRWFIRILLSAQTDPIESLYVSIEGEFSKLIDGTDKAVKQSKDKLEEFAQQAQKTGKESEKAFDRPRDALGRFIKKTEEGENKTSGFGAKLGLAFGLASAGATKLLDIVVNIASSTVQMFKNMATQAVQLAGDFEQVQLTFSNIFGSQTEANDFLKGLQSESAKLGLSFNEASQFAKSLFPDTSGIEQFNELLRVAAVGAGDAGLSLNELIFSFNEAVSGDFVSIRDRLDIPKDVIERVKQSDDVVGGLITELDKLFTKRGVNNLEATQGTLQGIQRRIKGIGEELLLVAGLEVLGPLREGFQRLLDIIDENRPAIDELATSIGEIAGLVVDFAREELFGSFNIKGPLESIKSFIDGVKNATGPVFAFVAEVKRLLISLEPLGKALAFVLVAINPLARAIVLLVSLLPRLDEAMLTASKGMAIITAVIEGVKVSILGLNTALGGIAKALVALITGDIQGFKAALLEANDGFKQASQGGAEAFKKSILESNEAINRLTDNTEKSTEAIEENTKSKKENAEVEPEPPLLDPSKIDQFSDQLIDATEQRNEQLEQLEIDHAEKVAQIQEDGNEKRTAIDEKFSDELAKLAKDSEEKRLDVIEDTREKLADLAEETDRNLATKRKEFDKDELRETEDHLKEMRRLEEDHLMSLSDAVKNRDAGAIVDLQRKFELESGRREEDFQEGQGQQREDFDADLEAVRQNEAQKRAEILEAQAQTLEDIRQNEDEKRLELESRRAEELEKLAQDQQEKLDRENQNYMERQAALDEALQKRLESIAQSLANEKDVTEEGAREILETFNEYFGIGGNIDKLMDDFASRRNKKAEIQAKFSGEDTSTSSTSSTSTNRLFGGFGQRLGGVQEFATGGTLIAAQPTLALFGEAGPEVVQFTPMSQLSSPGSQEPGRMVIEMTGSAPPGIGSGDRDQIAAVLINALRETGELG